MKTGTQYRKELSRMRGNIHIGGEKLNRDDPRLEQPINVVAATFDAALEPENKGLVTTLSKITGGEINRFCNIHCSTEDLLNKQAMTRKLCHRVGGCIQRCMGIDATNALSVITWDTDQKYGTDYNKRFMKWLEYFQTNDIVANCAQTDVKGDRSKRPHEQVDPDLYVRVVERKSDGVVVRGAKAHNTIAPYAQEIIVLPTRALTAEEKDWAIAFAIPADTEGIHQIVRLANIPQRVHLEAPIAHFGDAESLTVFDNVFVPWDRIFLNGETDMGGRLALQFAEYHRHSYTGCKPSITDIVLGMTSLVAEYNGVGKAQHIQHKLAHLIGVAELVTAAGIAASVTGKKTGSGTYIPNAIYVNVGRRLAGENIFHEYEILCDVAGGWYATLPFEEDWFNPETKGYLEKYTMRNPRISPENQHRLFRMISDMMTSHWFGVELGGQYHGGGSPIMETIGILRDYDLKPKMDHVKYLAGIALDDPHG
ncbi:MAG: 4-hydroxyphenylacetate 3-hydroxylase N-terminal domain-containing protein [Dehalococcoidales bacterium]|nr:4-hydroxyphenylacetate 3-hydroxylase N-terminal domain-containing protein [Dehalococcoidales bacterium]